MADSGEPSGPTELKLDAQYGQLPFDKFLIAWFDSTALSSVFPPFDRLPEEIQRVIQDLNAHIQVCHLRRVYIDRGWTLRQHYFPMRRSQSLSRSPDPQIPSALRAILPSLNTIQERNLIHEHISRDHSRVLRTCYRPSSADEARHQWLLDEYRESYASPETFLNDVSRYSLGGDYERIFEMMPDLLSGRVRHPAEDRVNDYVELLEGMPPKSVVGGHRIATDSIIHWIQVEDEAFFDGKPVLLVYYDEYGKTCISCRNEMTPGLQYGAWFDGCWRDTLDFVDDEGEDYREDGKRTMEWERRTRAEMVRLEKDEGVERRYAEQQEKEKQKGLGKTVWR